MRFSAILLKAASTLSDVRALVSSSGMPSSLASAAPSASVIARSVRSLLLPMSSLHVSGAAYFSTCAGGRAGARAGDERESRAARAGGRAQGGTGGKKQRARARRGFARFARSHLLQPLSHVLKAFPVRHVVDHDDAVGAPVVCRRDGPEPFLARRVPDLQLDRLVRHRHGAETKVHAWRGGRIGGGAREAGGRWMRRGRAGRR